MEVRRPRTFRSLWRLLLALLLIGGVLATTASPAAAATTLCSSSGFACTPGFDGHRVWGYPVDGNGVNGHNCTNYAAFKLAQNGASNPGNLGNAKDWDDNARAKGFAVDGNATVGSIAQWNSQQGMSLGHVAYVEVVTNDYIETTDDSYEGPTRRMKYYRNQAGWPNNFIHIKDVVVTPPVNTDADGDGFHGGDDWCPNLWGKGHGCPIKSDVSNDGKSDLLAFYRHDNDLTNLNQWNGQSNRYLSEPTLPWQGVGWAGQLMIPAGTGNVNGDNYQDYAAFFNHSGGMIDLNVWLGNSSGGVGQIRAWHMPTGSGWEGNRVKPVGMGDFDKDGRADVAAFYRYDNLNATLYVWRGQSNGTFAAPVDVWNASGWDVNLIKAVGIHDVDGDTNLDVATFYDHAGTTNDPTGTVDYNVWYGNGVMTFTLDRPWTTSGEGWDGALFMAPAITDLNQDGRGDAVIFYDHPGDGVQMRVWWGTANRVSGAPGMLWENWGQGWEADRMMSAGVGDYDGDNHPDVATFYRHNGQVVDVNVWFGDGAGVTLFRSWNTMTGWEGGRIYPAGIG